MQSNVIVCGSHKNHTHSHNVNLPEFHKKAHEGFVSSYNVKMMTMWGNKRLNGVAITM